MNVTTSKNRDTPHEPPLLRRLVPAFHPLIVFTVLFAVSLLSTPLGYHWQDTEQFFVPWMQSSEGLYPWRIYTGTPGCNYPPFCLYLLTIVEDMRRLLHAPPASLLTVCLLKFPFLLAHPLGVLVCYYGLRRPYGGKTARRVALLYALCLPLFVNGALWGQADALMLLAMVSALMLLVNDKPVLAGAAMGWALSIKFQSVFIAPMLLLYTFRRFGIKSVLLGCLAGIGALLLISLPFIVNGVGRSVLDSYTGAMGYYTLRSLNAMNLWGAANIIDSDYRHLPGDPNNDTFFAFGHVTYHQIGLTLMGAYVLFTLVLLWRRTSRDMLFFSSAMGSFGLFVLATQMHERYVVPAAALLALPALFSLPRLLLYAGLCLTASLNQIIVLYSNYYSFARHGGGDWVNELWGKSFFPGALVNCALLVVGTYIFLLPVRMGPGQEFAPPGRLRRRRRGRAQGRKKLSRTPPH